MFKHLLLIFIFILTACYQNNASKKSFYEAEGSNNERISKISSLIEKHHPLPTAILNAYFMQEKMGDGFIPNTF